MTDLSQMFRWNTGFVRGLAQSVLERAKVIRGSLSPQSGASEAASPARKSGAASAARKKITVKKSPKRPLKKTAKASARKSKKTNG